MVELLQSYSVSEIIIFIVLLATAFKGIVTFWDWGVERLNKAFNKKTKQEKKDNQLHECMADVNKNMNNLINNQNEMFDEIKNIKKTIQMLINSDRDDIKSWITEKHHYFCYNVKSIDDYNLDCIEKRYSHYVDEGGNSFVADLMEDIRALPKK